MPTNLDHQCSFVRVFPWRWVGKKGWAGTIDSNVVKVNPLWNYDWGNGATSSLDAEYCPMQWGGGYTTAINGKQASTEVLGYNEPDSTAQANPRLLAADDAIRIARGCAGGVGFRRHGPGAGLDL
jgi:hypothetical protein